MGQKPPHAVAIMRLTGGLVSLFGSRFVRIQLPIDVSDSDNATNEPEPDAAVLSRPGDEFVHGNPGPESVALVIEVADTSLRFDLRTKAGLYARAGIRDYWVVDLIGRRIVVHREPAADAYQQVMAYSETEPVAPLGRRDAPVAVADLLPPAE